MSGFHFIPAGGFDDSGRKAKYRADELLRLVEEIDLRMVCLFCGAKNVKSTVF
jgi:hypothetical protein